MIEHETQWNLLDWDTKFFGIPTARITAPVFEIDTLNQILDDISVAGGRVIHYLIDADHQRSIELAENAGFHLVDTRMTLCWRAAPIALPKLPTHISIRQHCAGDTLFLEEIARTSYRITRYYSDGHYDRERCNEMYALWIAQSCQHSHVLVAEHAGTPVGFITCEVPANSAHGVIGLVGVGAQSRGLGIGSLLVEAAQHWFAQQKIESVRVVTQGRNIVAQRIYQRMGFVSHALAYWYHKWL